jgi:hypothetical protein
MDDSRNVGVRFIEPAGKLPKRKEIRNVGVQFIEPVYGLDESSPYRGRPNIRQYRGVVERILLSLPERFSGLKIDWYVLMSTHLHVIFLFDGMKDGLPELVRTFKALVTRNTGVKFWQRNYYEHVIRNETTLFKIREYVENNPLAERIRFEEFYESGSDKSDPYKNSPHPH